MSLKFSLQPGCFERHLQRQYQNPLFSHRTTEITQADIQEAQQQDEAERQAFQEDFQKLLQQIATLEAQVEAEIIFKLKAQVDSLYECCARLGGNFENEKTGLRRLAELIMHSIWASGIDDPNTQHELKQEESAQAVHFSLLEYGVIADLLHPHSPIAEADIVPTLLSESEETLKATMTLFKPEQRHILCEEARKLLTQLDNQGYSLTEAWLRLATMEQAHG